MPDALHRFVEDGRRFVIDTETCFCFECDDISWDVLALYPNTPTNRIKHLLKDKHDPIVVDEVIGELEWLRHTSAILPKPKKEEASKPAAAPTSLRVVEYRLPASAAEQRAKRRWGGVKSGASTNGDPYGRDAVSLLVARAGDEPARIVFAADRVLPDADAVTELCEHALRTGKLAGKPLQAEVRVDDIGGNASGLDGHRVSASAIFGADADPAATVRAIAGLQNAAIGKWAKTLQNAGELVTAKVTLRPGDANFGEAVKALRDAGFNWIELDLHGAFAARPDLDPMAMAEALNGVARAYAESLAAHKYYRLDPIAELFNHIYEGKPNRRADLSGAQSLFISEDGGIFAGEYFAGKSAFEFGSIADAAIDEDARAAFYDLGAQNIGVCRACWARSLCGGGAAAVHHARTGAIHAPDAAWCDAQRKWLAALVASFNVLSSEGVDFTRVYHSLTLTGRPSLFGALKAAFQQTIGMRPIEEADAELLRDWEEWNDAAYFAFSETSVLMTTLYDREMDALHPQAQHQELMLIRRDGTPMGLFRLKPERTKGAAEAALYFRYEEDYAADSVRKGFQNLMAQAGGQQQLRRLTVPVSEQEAGLQQFLEAVGFQREGTLREALFLHDAYQDVHLYGYTLQ
jgi:radical SAM protein with 4Fe4S-binding SPASM domain